VLTGIDVLVRDGFRQLAGKRVAVITNHTGLDRERRRTASLLAKADGVKLVAILGPEHGASGTFDQANVPDGKDEETGVSVKSLYGATKRPTPEMLADVDTIVFDIQDIGCRFYTYVSTMLEAMKAAAEHKKAFVVLDRPNPIDGVSMAGPLVDAGAETFVGCHPIPLRHGMTVGELAKMFAADLKLDLDLTVIPCEGWRRTDAFDATGLEWVNPSPNMRSLTEAFLYPGIGLLEFTNLSVGRGTDTPFEVIGAPWLDGRVLADALAARRIPGVGFVPIRFTPSASKFKGEPCGGVNIAVTDRAVLDPVRVGLEISVALRQLYPKEWEAEKIATLLLHRSTLDAILAGDVRPAGTPIHDMLLRLVVDEQLVLTPAADLGDTPPGDAVFLGRMPDGRHAWSVRAPLQVPDGIPARAVDPRRGGVRFDDVSAQLVSCALALLNWHDNAGFSPSDGSPTRPVRAGWARRNLLTGHEEFPRVDPAVICLVHDGGDRAVLARQVAWPPRLFSLLAGFVEAGESFETCVMREIAEEIGLTVTDVTYLGSQPWPFPRSLMVGFHAIADPEQDFAYNDGEIAEAAWFTRDEVRAALAEGDWSSESTSRLLLPGSISIAREIIESWAYSG
jgi:uncharacterized protein YbbC (DUF1343 family)/NADH pyrophosphatase NudC (nudix superfamily)